MNSSHISAPTGARSELDVAAVAPALADYRDRIIEGELWQRPGLSARDRSVVTVAALVARDQQQTWVGNSPARRSRREDIDAH